MKYIGLSSRQIKVQVNYGIKNKLMIPAVRKVAKRNSKQVDRRRAKGSKKSKKLHNIAIGQAHCTDIYTILFTQTHHTIRRLWVHGHESNLDGCSSNQSRHANRSVGRFVRWLATQRRRLTLKHKQAEQENRTEAK